MDNTLKKTTLNFSAAADETLNRIAKAWSTDKQTALLHAVDIADIIATPPDGMPDEWMLVMQKDGARGEILPFASDTSTGGGTAATRNFIPMVVEFYQASEDALNRVAKRCGASQGDALCKTLGLVHFLIQKESEGWEFSLDRKDGSMHLSQSPLPLPPSSPYAALSPTLH